MPIPFPVTTAMPEYWSNMVKDIGALLGMLIAAATVMYGVARFLSRGFGKAVTTHVKPLVDTLSTSLNDVALTMQHVQREHARTAEHFAEDRRVKQERIDEHTERLDESDKVQADHETRITVIEANPALEAKPKSTRRRS